MMGEAFSGFEITDAYGFSQHLEKIRDLRRFVASERAAWSWVKKSDHAQIDLSESYLRNYDHIDEWINEFERGHISIESLRNNILNLYQSDHPNIVPSGGKYGQILFSIAQKFGESKAEIVLALLTRRLALDLQQITHFQLWQMIAEPSLIGPSAWSEVERARLRQVRLDLVDELAKFQNRQDEHLQEVSDLAEKQRSKYRSNAWRAIKELIKRTRIIEDRIDSAIDNINSVALTYDEKMNLMAPVKYWRGKSRSHRKGESFWGIFLIVYILIASVVSYFSFKELWSTVGEGQLSGKHFLLVAAIGSGLTLLFWVARTIMRIFLGERHLRTDADERRVMTQAYLALIRSGGATESERMIILTALFRSASDGIIADDSSGDVSIPAMVARILEQKAK